MAAITKLSPWPSNVSGNHCAVVEIVVFPLSEVCPDVSKSVIETGCGRFPLIGLPEASYGSTAMREYAPGDAIASGAVSAILMPESCETKTAKYIVCPAAIPIVCGPREAATRDAPPLLKEAAVLIEFHCPL